MSANELWRIVWRINCFVTAALAVHCQLIARQTNPIPHEMTPVKKKVIYHAQRIPSQFDLRHLPEWIRLWRFRWGIETGIDELEPGERIATCNSQNGLSFYLLVVVL